MAGRTTTQKQKHNLVGHREKFSDGVFVCMGSFGHIKDRAETMAKEMERRYGYKSRITEKTTRTRGEHGFVKKPLFLIWVKAK